MARTISTVTVADLPRLVQDESRGTFSLVGKRGNLSRIIAEVYASNVVMGGLAIETEHGTVYRDLEDEIRVSEDDGGSLDDRVDGSLYAINDILTGHLAGSFGWYAHEEDQYSALNELTHVTAGAIDDLLGQFPASASNNQLTDEEAWPMVHPLCQTCADPRCQKDADGFCKAHGWDCDDFHLELQQRSTGHHLVIERQYSADLVISYPSQDAAEKALVDDVFIDGLCEEDCLDAYTAAQIPAHRDEFEVATPPQEQP